jgi:iron complex transport system permease protein
VNANGATDLMKSQKQNGTEPGTEPGPVPRSTPAKSPARRPSYRGGVLRLGPFSVRIDTRSLIVGCVLLLLAGAVAVLSIGTGDYPLTPVEVLKTLVGNGPPGADFVVNELRLPRVLTGLMVGAALAVSGAVFQSLARNPLGSPDIIGFTTGAATGGLLAIVMLGGGSLAVPFGAIIGGLVTAVAVYLLAWKNGVHGYRLVLIGIGFSAVVSALNSYLMVKADIEEAAEAMVWLTGSLNGRGWEHAVPVGIALLVLLPFVLVLGRGLTMLEMGDDSAHALGVTVGRLRLALLIGSVALAAVATASAGPIPFIALAAPQLARRLTRAPGPNLLPAACMGALLTLLADYTAQRIFPNTQLPVGVMTASLGGLYLLWLLVRERKAGRS